MDLASSHRCLKVLNAQLRIELLKANLTCFALCSSVAGGAVARVAIHSIIAGSAIHAGDERTAVADI